MVKIKSPNFRADYPLLWKEYLTFITKCNVIHALKQDIKSKILNIFADLDQAPVRYGDAMQHPIFLRLGDMERDCGDAMREPLQEAISETKYRVAGVCGIQFLGVLPGSAPYLADIAVNHYDEWHRSAAVESLELLGEREILYSIYDRIPMNDREHAGKTLIFMDAELLGGYSPMVSRLLRGRHPGKRWDESKAKVGEAKSLEIVVMVRDHPQLPESVRPIVRDICLELSHGR